jgi:hypothetical protein
MFIHLWEMLAASAWCHGLTKGVCAARSDGNDAIIRLQHVTQARDLEGDGRVGHQQGRLQARGDKDDNVRGKIMRQWPLMVNRNEERRKVGLFTSSRRRYLSVLQALARSTHARVSCPGCSSSFRSSLSMSVKQSAVDPAKPATMSSPIRRTCHATWGHS